MAIFFKRTKNRKIKMLRAAVVGLVLIAATLSAQPSYSARLTGFSVTLSTSKPSTAGNVRFSFTTATLLSGDTTDDDDDSKIVINFPTDAGGDPFSLAAMTASDISLVSGFPAGVTVNSVTLSDGGGTAANDTITIGLDQTTTGPAAVDISASTALVFDVINNKITNPAKVDVTGEADIYSVSVKTQDDGGSDVDSGGARVAVQDEIAVSGTVNTTLSLTVAGITSGNTCRGARTASATSTPATLPFGTMTADSALQLCHSLTIATNAPNGYNLHVVQNQNMTSGSDDIDQFKDGTRVDDASATAWTASSINAGDEQTFGHLGYGSSDTGVFADQDTFAGIPTKPAAGAAPVTTGLACDNSAAATNDTCTVEYRVEISALQPAGTYSSEVEYVIVAQY